MRRWRAAWKPPCALTPTTIPAGTLAAHGAAVTGRRGARAACANALNKTGPLSGGHSNTGLPRVSLNDGGEMPCLVACAYASPHFPVLGRPSGPTPWHRDGNATAEGARIRTGVPRAMRGSGTGSSPRHLAPTPVALERGRASRTQLRRVRSSPSCSLGSTTRFTASYPVASTVAIDRAQGGRSRNRDNFSPPLRQSIWPGRGRSKLVFAVGRPDCADIRS